MKFLVAYKKDGKTLLKIGMEGGEEKWMVCSEAVFNFAKNNIKGSDRDTKYQGDEVDVEYNENNGQYTVTRITKKGVTTTQTSTNTPPAEFVCVDCGYVLKDGKYKKCYNCNKKAPTQKPTPAYACEDCGDELKDDKYKKCYTCNQKSPSSSSNKEIQDYINRQNANHATSRTLIALQGHIDPNNVVELIDVIHAHYMKKITG